MIYEDYFGTPIKIGDAGIRTTMETYRPFRKCRVVKFDPKRRYDPIGILIENGKRKSWVSSHQIIAQGSFRVQVFDDMNKKIEDIEDIE